jgi:transcriptional regulator with XRE-family HTH domain
MNRERKANMSTYKAIMSQNLKKLIKAKHITIKQFAKDMDVPYTTAVDWTNGRNYPNPERLKMIAEYFGVDYMALLGGHLRKGEPDKLQIEIEKALPAFQTEPIKELVNAYLNADDKTRRAVRALLEIDYKGE